MPLSDLLEAMNNPEAYILRRVRESEGGDQELQRNLYATGYQGQEPSGITQPRGMFGSALEGIGILGPSPDRPLTPYEHFLVTKGQESKGQYDYTKGKQDFATKKSESDFQTQQYENILNITGAARDIPQGLVGNNPDLHETAQSLLRYTLQNDADKATQDRLNETLTRARLHFLVKNKGHSGGGKTLEEKAQEAARKSEKEQLARVKSFESGTFNKPLVKEFQDFLGGTNFNTKDVTKGSLFDAMGGAAKQSDKSNTLIKYSEFRNRYKAALIQHGVDPEFAEMYMKAYEPPALDQVQKSPLGYAQPLPPTAPGQFDEQLYDSLMTRE